MSILGIERRNNQGEAALLRLLEAKATQAEMSLKAVMSPDAFGDGTGNNSKALTGLAAIVSTTATCGGLAPATFAWWKGNVTSSVGSFAANGINNMRIAFNNVTFGNDKPDFLVTDQTTFQYYEAALQPAERFVNTKAADAGFQTLTFKGVPLFFDRDCTAGYMYFLNSKYLKFVVHRDADFATGPFITPENQDASTAQILFQGNLTTNNRRMNAVLQGITA
ncbi:MAG: phage major capsid protein [Patescibacteria group bacterium]|nr:phage major capsid protein [Patescibacteria group bacterium]MDE2227283.1 phage major capsid protein [Patescibacteria group bacterium]